MTSPHRPGLPLAAAVCLALGLVAGCGGDQGGFSSGRLFGPSGLLAAKPPSASTPEGTLALLEWCWDHRNLDRYSELFTEDYRATCGDPTVPDLTNAEELVAARTLFTTARHIRFDYASPPVFVNDSRPGKTAPFHRESRTITTALVVDRDGRRLELDEVVRFYVVRGDSALIPPELRDQGFRPDAGRWYIERWESLGPTPGSRIEGDTGRITATSWCDLKRRTALAAH